jgi:hypothetical protein
MPSLNGKRVTKTKRTGFKARKNRENPVLKQQRCVETEEPDGNMRPGKKKEGESLLVDRVDSAIIRLDISSAVTQYVSTKGGIDCSL